MASKTQTFSLRKDPTQRKWLQFLLIAMVICALILYTTPGEGAYWTCGVCVAILFMVGVLADRRNFLEIDLLEAAIRIRGDLYGKTWPLATFHVDQARLIDLAQEPEFRPKWKLWGTSMAGYQSGTFRLHNGKSATLFLSAKDSVLVLPFRDGSILLLSVGQDFLDALRQRKV